MRASVIIPAHNASDTIQSALASALSQTEGDLEVLVVNDRSSDQTELIVLQMAAKDQRVRLLQNKGAQGPSAARNTALAECRGKWLVLLDADDTMHPNRVESLICQAEARGLDALADNLQLIDFLTGASVGTAFPDAMMQYENLIDIEWLLRHDIPGGDHRTFGCCKPVIRIDAIKEAGLSYDEDIRLGEDYLLYGRMVSAGLRFGTTTDRLYCYTLRASSLTHTLIDSSSNIEVNRRIREASVRAKNAIQVMKLFRVREAAFRYEDFVYALKRRQFRRLIKATYKLKTLFALKKLLRATIERIGKQFATKA